MNNSKITVNATHYIVCLNGTRHHVRRDGVCSCGASPRAPCAAYPPIRTYLRAGSPRPPGRDDRTWPQSWAAIPQACPICTCPTQPDPHLNSRAGPGWICTLGRYEHFWRVRTNPLRQYLAAHPLEPSYPWVRRVTA